MVYKPLTNECWINYSIISLQDNPVVGLNYVLLPGVLGCYKNLHQGAEVDPSHFQVLSHFCRLEYNHDLDQGIYDQFSFLSFAFQRPLHERHNGREWVWSWDCQTMGSSEAPRHAGKEHANLEQLPLRKKLERSIACLFSGWFDHPAVEEDQHEGSPALPDQGDLPVHLHRPGHHCQVRLNNYY